MLYSAPDTEICNWSIQFMLKQMTGKKKNFVMLETYRSLLLILTIPAMMAPVEKTFSILNRINSFTRSAQSQKTLIRLVLMSIEKEL